MTDTDSKLRIGHEGLVMSSTSTIERVLHPPLPANTTQAATAATAAKQSQARRWWILAVLAIAQLMVVLDATVVNIALPSAQRSLAFSDSNRQWIVTAYALAFGSLLLLGGRLADVLGRKRTFLTGLAGFAVASAIGGFATNFAMLVSARAVQGAFGALLAPAALALLTTTFRDARERSRAVGIYSAVAGGGGALGLLLGGVLTEYASWRWTLLVNLGFAAIGLVGGTLLLRHERSEHRPRLDWPGTITVSAGLLALVYGFSRAQSSGWAQPTTLLCFAAAALLLGAFVGIQARAAEPLLPLGVVLDRNRGGAFLALFVSAAGMFGVFLFLTYFLQSSLGYSAVRTGLSFLPMTAMAVAVSSVVSTVVARRITPRIVLPAGLLTAAAGMLLLTRISLASNYSTDILPATLVLGVGLGVIFAGSIGLATVGVEPDVAGVASALVNTMQQVGGSIGTALLNTLAASGATSYLVHHIGAPRAASLAAVHSYVLAFGWSAAIFVLGAALCATVLRSGVPSYSNNPAVSAIV